MDVLGLVNIPVWVLIVLALCFLYYMYSTANFGVFNTMGVPGPKPTVLMGNLREIVKKGFVEMEGEWVKKYGRVYGIFEGRNPILIVGDLDMLKDIMVKHFHSFTNRRDFGMRSHDVPPVTQFLTIIADDDWKHNRNSLTPAFTSGKLKKMTDSICKAAESFVEALKEKADKHEPMDVKQFTSGYTMEVIAATSFGMKLDAQKADDDPFVKYAMKFFKVSVTNPFVLASFVCPFVLPVMKLLKISAMPTDSIDFFKKIVDQALEQRRSNPGKYNDFLQLMITAENQARSAETQSHDDDGLKGGEVQQSNWKDKRMGQGLSDSEILAQCITFFVAGFDTSAATIAYALYHLTMNPECQQKLVDEIDDYYPGGKVPDYDELPEMPYLNMVINETLRMNPPAARVDRMCTRDTDVCGLHIPAGMPVAIPIYNIHRDPEYWDEPDTFNPERFSPENRASHHPLQWIPFGHGPRNCIGMRLALLEIRIALVYLFQKYRFVPNSKTLPLRFGESLFLTNPKDGIWVTPQHRD